MKGEGFAFRGCEEIAGFKGLGFEVFRCLERKTRPWVVMLLGSEFRRLSDI